MKRFVNPAPGARSLRRDDHDYRGGAYFVTTNTRKRVPLFGHVERGRMCLNRYGEIVAEEWERTGELREAVSLDAFIVMPDHVHGLLWICHSDDNLKHDESTEGPENQEDKPEKKGREVHLATSSNLPPGLEKRRPGTLSTIIGCFKAAVTRRINGHRDTQSETVWQSQFHDRIVRNREELDRIRQYIHSNPERWHRD